MAEVKRACLETRQLLERDQLEHLERRQAAFNILNADWQTKVPLPARNSMPAEQQNGLALEQAVLKQLFAHALELQSLLKECEAAANDPAAFAGLRERTTKLSNDLRALETSLRDRAQARQEFKKRLNQTLDVLTQYNLPSFSTYVAIRTELDPGILDLLVNQHRNLLLPVELGMKVLQ